MVSVNPDNNSKLLSVFFSYISLDKFDSMFCCYFTDRKITNFGLKYTYICNSVILTQRFLYISYY